MPTHGKKAAALFLCLLASLAFSACALTGGTPTLQAALLGKQDILCYGNSPQPQRLGIDAVPAYFSPDSSTAQVWRFAPIDLDSDGETEVVLQVIDAAGDMGGYLVLRLEGKTIRGYYKNYRWFDGLKSDGTFGYTDTPGAGWGIGSIRFGADGDTCEATALLWQEEQSGEPAAWYIGQEPVGEEEFSSALARQEAKEDAVWYDFTPEGIEEAFSAR